MAVVDYGFPNRVFFELYAGEHPSEKIYSVQVKDWIRYFEYEHGRPASNLTDKDGNPIKLREYDDRAAVVQVDLDQVMTNHEIHMQVEPTADLIAFMGSRGISLPETIYIQPLAFAWSRDGEFDVDEDFEDTVEPQPDGGKEKGSKTKAILATLVAALALLN